MKVPLLFTGICSYSSDLYVCKPIYLPTRMDDTIQHDKVKNNSSGDSSGSVYALATSRYIMLSWLQYYNSSTYIDAADNRRSRRRRVLVYGSVQQPAQKKRQGLQQQYMYLVRTCMYATKNMCCQNITSLQIARSRTGHQLRDSTED